MALKKDQIIVWMSSQKAGSQNLLFLLACPYSRLKDFDQRLSNAYQHKVKGNRLENLDAMNLDGKNLSFTDTYLAALFRIADIAGFGGMWYAKTPLLEAKVLEQAAAFLKEQYVDCQFIVRYEPRQFRSSTLNTWTRKNQLPSSLEADDMESLPAQTAHLLSALQQDLQEDSEQHLPLEQLQSRLLQSVSMARKWQIVSAAKTYLELVDGKERKELKKLLAQVPQLISEGVLDKWLKNRLPAHFLTKALALAHTPEGKERLLTLSVSRIDTQYEKILAEVQSAQLPFEEDAFVLWAKEYADHFLALPGFEAAGLTNSLVEENLKEIVEAWCKNPDPVKAKNSLYLAARDEKLDILVTSSMDILEAAKEQETVFNPSLLAAKYEGLLLELDGLLEKLSVTRPMPKIYAAGNIYRWIRRWSITNNRFLPLQEMDKPQKEILRSFAAIQAGADSWKDWPERPDKPVHWFDPRLFLELDEEQLAFLAGTCLNPALTRLMGLAFFNGLDVKKARNYFLYSKGPLYALVRTYIFSTREQHYLDGITSPGLRTFLMQPGLSLSQMRTLAGLVEQGIPVSWLEANIKGNMSLAAMNRLAVLYPWKTLPYEWRFFRLLPDELAKWMVEKAQSSHPKLEKEVLLEKLANFNEQADLLVFNQIAQKITSKRLNDQSSKTARKPDQKTGLKKKKARS